MIVPCPECTAKNRIPETRLDGTARCAKCKTPLVPFDEPVPVETPEGFDALIEGSPLPVLVDFWAEWCGPCRMVGPELEKLAAQRKGQLVVAKLDTDAVPEIAARFQIRSIPTLVLFSSGQPQSRLSGAMPLSEIVRQLGL